MKDVASDQHGPQRNALFAALSVAERERVADNLQLVPLALGLSEARRAGKKVPRKKKAKKK